MEVPIQVTTAGPDDAAHLLQVAYGAHGLEAPPVHGAEPFAEALRRLREFEAVLEGMAAMPRGGTIVSRERYMRKVLIGVVFGEGIVWSVWVYINSELVTDECYQAGVRGEYEAQVEACTDFIDTASIVGLDAAKLYSNRGKAYAELGDDYEAQKAIIVDPAQANEHLPIEVWHAREGISRYATVGDFLKAVAGFRATGAKLNATYVYDAETGLKLFGKTAFYVADGEGGFATFLRKGEAERHAAATGGKVLDFEDALQALPVES